MTMRTSEINGRLWSARATDWAEVQEGVHRPVYEAVMDRCAVAAGTRYLDAGCGAGMACAMAAGRGAKVSGFDASPALLEISRSRTPAGDFRLADLEAPPFADQAFDLVTGFNAFQYAGDPVAALFQARRMVKLDGFVVVVTWGDPAAMPAASLVTALKDLLPPPPPGAAGPFALSDEGRLRRLAVDAGLETLEVFDVDSPFVYADEATALRGLNASGVAARAMEQSGEAAVTEAHRQALASFRRADGRFVAEGSFRCLLARPRH
jgi:SAM-dependent methyltransferase